MKKIISIAITTSLMLLTACYPTGKENLSPAEPIAIEELNSTTKENITFDFNSKPEYETSYPHITAKWIDREKFDEQACKLFLEGENNTDFDKINDNLPGIWNEKKNTHTDYCFKNEGGFLALDNGVITYMKSYDRCEANGYISDIINTLLSPENVRKYYTINKTNSVDLDTVMKNSQEILKLLNIDITSEPEVYVINKDNLENLPYHEKGRFSNFKADDEAYLLQYRYSIDGLDLPAFRTKSSAKNADGIDPWVTFVYSGHGLEYFNADMIEVTEKTEKKEICSYESAAAAAKSYVEGTVYKNGENVTVSGGELNYITEIDYDNYSINAKPVWTFLKVSVFDDDQQQVPYCDSIIIDATTGNIYA